MGQRELSSRHGSSSIPPCEYPASLQPQAVGAACGSSVGSYDAVTNVESLARLASRAGAMLPLDLNMSPHVGGAFQSCAVRFAVAIAERLPAAANLRSNSPSTDSCYTCLSILREMVPLLGPLGPVLQNVHEAMQVCLLSDQHYGNIYPSERGAEKAPTGRSLRHGVGPFPVRVSADSTARDGSASPRVGAPRHDDDDDPAWCGSCGGERARGHAAGFGVRFNRVPYFLLVRKLEEANRIMRTERDASIKAVSDNHKHFSSVSTKLAVANERLSVKTATIEKLRLDLTALDSELATACEFTKREERKHDVLQAECVSLTRDFLTSTQRLEGEIDKLRADNDQLLRDDH